MSSDWDYVGLGIGIGIEIGMRMGMGNGNGKVPPVPGDDSIISSPLDIFCILPFDIHFSLSHAYEFKLKSFVVTIGGYTYRVALY